MVVSFVHVKEARTTRIVWAIEWMFRLEVDMICDKHQVANLKVWICTSTGVADKERADAEFCHNALGESDLLHVVSLIVVETSFKRHHLFGAEVAEEKATAVPFHC